MCIICKTLPWWLSEHSSALIDMHGMQASIEKMSTKTSLACLLSMKNRFSVCNCGVWLAACQCLHPFNVSYRELAGRRENSKTNRGNVFVLVYSACVHACVSVCAPTCV